MMELKLLYNCAQGWATGGGSMCIGCVVDIVESGVYTTFVLQCIVFVIRYIWQT